LGLVEKLRPELTFRLSEVVSLDLGQSEIIHSRASEIAKGAAVQILRSYKVDIYYDKNSTKDKNISNRIKSLMETTKIIRKVILAPKPSKWFSSVGRPTGFEVRYEPEREDDAARALISVLNNAYRLLSLKLQ